MQTIKNFLSSIWGIIETVQMARAEYIVKTGNIRRWE